jgi:hypothetical protein
MRVLDDASGKLVGHLSDISADGFKLDSKYAVPLEVDLRLRIDQTGAISSKSSLVFTARAKWCRRDLSDPLIYNVGFQLVDMNPEDYEIFVKMFHTYGTQVNQKQDEGPLDYLFKPLP